MNDINWQALAKLAADSETKVSLNIEISNISEDQAKKFVRLFAWMNYLGGIGASRSFSVSCDGDGAFRPRIKVDGKEVHPDEDDKKQEDHDGYENLSFGFD